MIKLQNIKKSYDGVNQVLNNINITINDSEVIAILGPSGCGKTTLLKIISGLIPFEGEIINKPLRPGFIFQEDRLVENLTVFENLELIVPNKCEEILKLLEKFELLEKKDFYPKKLSGGEKKRVNMARAFLYDSDIILADEAFSSLDTGLKTRLIKEFGDMILSNKKTCFFVTHDPEEALMIANRIIIINEGVIIREFEIPDQIPRKYSENNKIRDEILEIILNI